MYRWTNYRIYEGQKEEKNPHELKKEVLPHSQAVLFEVQGTFSLKLLGGKLAPKLVYFVLRKELLNF